MSGFILSFSINLIIVLGAVMSKLVEYMVEISRCINVRFYCVVLYQFTTCSLCRFVETCQNMSKIVENSSCIYVMFYCVVLYQFNTCSWDMLVKKNFNLLKLVEIGRKFKMDKFLVLLCRFISM